MSGVVPDLSFASAPLYSSLFQYCLAPLSCLVCYSGMCFQTDTVSESGSMDSLGGEGTPTHLRHTPLLGIASTATVGRRKLTPLGSYRIHSALIIHILL